MDVGIGIQETKGGARYEQRLSVNMYRERRFGAFRKNTIVITCMHVLVQLTPNIFNLKNILQVHTSY